MRSYQPPVSVAVRAWLRCASPTGWARNSLAHIMGTSVSDTTAEIRIVTASVAANSRNRRPTTSCMNSNGISTATSDTVSEMIVKPICFEPFSAASSGLSPCSRNRAMFSIMTIASSTTKPVAIVSAISERLLRLKCARYMTPKVPTSDNGTDKAGITVAGTLRRNRKITITTSAMANANSNCTSRIDARIVVVRSVSILTSTPAGSEACRLGSSFLMLLTTSTTLAFGWRCTLMINAGVSFIQPPSLVFSAPCTSVATSLSRTAAELR